MLSSSVPPKPTVLIARAERGTGTIAHHGVETALSRRRWGQVSDPQRAINRDLLKRQQTILPSTTVTVREADFHFYVAHPFESSGQAQFHTRRRRALAELDGLTL